MTERSGGVAAELRAALDVAEAAARNPLERWLRSPRSSASGAALRAWARLVPRECTAQIFTGHSLRVLLPELVATTLHRDGFIEADMTRVMIDHLRPGMTVVDVGAQYGYHTLLAALLVGPTGHVIALEPTPSTFTLLRRNVGALPGVELVQAAAGDAQGSTEMYDFGTRHSALNSILPEPRIPRRERRRLRGVPFTVSLMELDTALQMRGLEPDFVKIDAESSELRVLTGMRRILARGRPMITVETGDYGARGQPSTRACIDHLVALGYRCQEYNGGLRDHRPRNTYGYGNLYFTRAPCAGSTAPG